MKSDIPREPPVPRLNDEVIERLTRLCFGEQDHLVQPCEALFAFGTPIIQAQHMCAERIRYACCILGVKRAYITGGATNGEEPESYQIGALVEPRRCSGVEFKLERKSDCTVKNVTFALALGLPQEKEVLFIARWYHCGRCRLVFAKHTPDIVLRQSGYVSTFERAAGTLTPDFWFKDPVYQSRVWGEFRRIERDCLNGTISYPTEIQEQVRQIRELTAGQK